MLGLATHQHWGAITCTQEPSLGHATGQPRKAFAQVWPRSDGVSWDLSFLTPSLDQAAWVAKSWLDLLQLLMVLGGQRQVQRLCARVPENNAIEETLRQAGLCVIGREEIFCLSQRVKYVAAPNGLQRMTWEHRQAVRALYHAVQPRLQHQAESMRPCEGTAYYHPPRPGNSDAFVWQVDNQVVAYFGLAETSRGGWLEVIVRPEVRGDIAPHIRYMVGLAAPNRQQPLYCAVPDHSIGLGWILRTLSFDSFARQSLLVGYPLARIGVRRPMVIPGLERRVDIGTPAQGMQHEGTDPIGGSCH